MKKRINVKAYRRKGKKVKAHTKRVRKKAWLDDEDIPTDLPEVGFLGGYPILPKDKSGGWDVPAGRRRKASHNIYKVEYDPERHQPITKGRMKRVRKSISFFRETAGPGEKSIFDVSDEEARKQGFEDELRERAYEREASLNLPGFADKDEVEEATRKAIEFETELANSKNRKELEDKYGW